MKTYNPGVTISLLAAADIVKHRFMKPDGNYAGADGLSIGVSDATTDSGRMAPVVVTGVGLIEAAGAITQGVKVYSDATGKGTATGTNNPGGIALDAASGAGEYIRVKLV